MKIVLLLTLLAPLLPAQRITPDLRLTPGAVMPGVTMTDILTEGYSRSVRNVPIYEKREVYREYGIRYVRRAYECDHLVPLSWGGSNDIRNLWPEPYSGVWNASVKDQLELAGLKKIRRGTLSLEEAQREIATDWIGMYKQVFHTNVPRPERHKRYREEH